MLAPDPMQSFQIGQSIGKANSPVSGLGQAITNIVEDARKRGLLQMEQDVKTQGAIDVAQTTQPFKIAAAEAQSESQGAQSRKTALEKYDRGQEELKTPKSTQIVDPSTGQVINTVEGTQGGDVKLAPAVDPFKAFMANTLLPKDGATPPPAETTDVVTIRFSDGTTADMPRSEAISKGFIKN